MRKPLKSALHHWWPRSLSKFWVDTDGRANQLSWDGKLARSWPAKFGAIRDAHLIKYDDAVTDWDETFEPAFDVADGRFPSIVESLLGLQTSNKAANSEFGVRLEAHPESKEMLDDLANCIISLIVRSPAFRYSIHATVEQFRTQAGLADLEPDDSLVGMNMRHCQRLFSRAIAGQGKFVVLYTDSREFIFGDGFLHNFSSSANPPLIPRCLVPLTPTMSVLYARPLTYRTNPRLMTIRLLPEEVRFLNDAIQVYSRDFVFYRSERPTILTQFSQRRFLQYEFHKQPWLDGLITTAANAYFEPMKQRRNAGFVHHRWNG